MATKSELSKLLNLLPFDVLKKATVSRAAQKTKLIEGLIASKTEGQILALVAELFPHTKQHAHILSLDPSDNLRRLPANPLSIGSLQSKTKNGSEQRFLYLVDLTYEVILTESLERKFIKFKWPVLASFQSGLLQLCFTILEKDLEYYAGGPVIVRSRQPTEAILVKTIKSDLEDFYALTPTDLNKGLKALWKGNAIDAKAIRYRDPKSTTSQVMDPQYTLKKSYPDKYQYALGCPLLKCLFRFIEAKPPVQHFSIDPTAGIVTFPRFSESKNGTTDVLRRILEAN